jgi:GWxTD domain-containing protein
MTLKALAVALSLAFAASILGQEAPPPKQPVERPDAIRKLSRRERRARIDKLQVRHQEFLADVEPIMLPAEVDLFLSLESDGDRDSFVDEFWRRRDAMNHTSGHFRDAYYKRLELAKELFKRTNTDRAKLFLLHGPPAEVIRSNCPRLLQPTEIWKYPRLPGMGADARILFYKPRHQNDFRLWNPVGGSMALSDLLVTSDIVAERSLGEAKARDNLAQSASPYAYISKIQLECSDGGEITMAITRMVQSRIDLLKLFEPPELNQEDVRKMLRSVIIANPVARKLTTEVEVRYPT